jgi:hypothetical protein
MGSKKTPEILAEEAAPSPAERVQPGWKGLRSGFAIMPWGS